MQGTLFPNTLAGPRSGKHGSVVRDGSIAVEQLKFWTLNETNAVEDLVHSASKGGHNRVSGFDDFTVNLEGFGGFPPFFPGDHVIANLFAGPDDGILGHLGKIWIAPVRISNLNINWNYMPSGSLEWSALGEANGCLDEPTDNSLLDVSEICTPQMCSLLVWAGDCETDDTNYTTIKNVLSASLSITAANPMYTNSSTECCTKREAGNIDWTLSVTDQEGNRTFEYGQYYGFKLYINATEYWLIKFGHHGGVSNITVNRQTGDIKSKQNNFAMSGQICCGGSDFQEGIIKDPSGITQWPIAPVAP